MPKRDPRSPDLMEDLDLLLGLLRDEWDFEGGLRSSDLIEGSQSLTSKRFPDTVLDAESVLSGNRASWERRVKRRFVQRYGHEIDRRSYRL